MAILFKAFKSSLKNKQGRNLFYPRVVRTGNVTTNKIAEDIAGYSSLSTGDVKNTLDNLSIAMSRYLQSSQSVTLDGIGTFRAVMVSKGKGVENAEDVSSTQSVVTVKFKPAFKRGSNKKISTRSMVQDAQFARFETVAKEKETAEVDGSRL